MKTQHKTKLVATIGPATNTYESLLEMVQAGVDVCRLNFSHGDRSTLQNQVNLIRKINADFDYNLAILGDLQGPKIRVREVRVLRKVLAKLFVQRLSGWRGLCCPGCRWPYASAPEIPWAALGRN